MSLLWTFHTQTNIRDVNRRRENHVSFKKSETANEDDETDEISNCESNVDILLRKREDNEAYDRMRSNGILATKLSVETMQILQWASEIALTPEQSINCKHPLGSCAESPEEFKE
ncbi:14034_t:CDS:2 [Rhizophagus irregularis]|nr:14034_t:CDS:2 [Rhizophagus irregularis]